MRLLNQMSEDNGESDFEGISVSRRFMGILFLGLILVFIGITVIVLAASFSSGGSVSSGVVILIGPIPIVFGSGPESLVLILVGVVVTILSVVLFIVLNRRFKKM